LLGKTEKKETDSSIIKHGSRKVEASLYALTILYNDLQGYSK